MNIEMILSSAVITTILSGIISFGISRKEGKLLYITGERKDWREKIRNISCKLNGVDYKETLKILTELKVRINAFGNRENIVNYNSDAHIWDVINEIEKEELDTKHLQEKQRQLIEYLALLLKFDWERSKKETKGDIYSVISLILLLISEVFFIISTYYLHIQELKIFEFVSTSIAFFVLMLCLYFIVKMEAKAICIQYLNGVHKGKIKEYKRIKLSGAYIIWGISGIALMLMYVDILTDFIEFISCGENNLLIILITALFYFCGLTLMGWSEVMEADTIYYYNKGINLIRLYYDKEQDKSNK